MAGKSSKPTLEEIDYRTRLANCEALEIKVRRDQFELDNKRGELCRIDTALTAFDGFLREFVGFLDSLPDAIQTLIPQATPTQYKDVQELIGTQLQRLADRRLHLSIESNTAQQQANTAAKNERIARTAKRKKDEGK
ncbi:MAG: hypothetical protein IJ165_09980 [Proteobacteria bacterium]|nr:hypothetical protein [Pseudomonadota bacterium]